MILDGRLQENNAEKNIEEEKLKKMQRWKQL
jgi:hypothetical protein